MRIAHVLARGPLPCPTFALEDPCKAVPERGPLPAYLARGETLIGPVLYVGDGDSLCVDAGAGQDRRVEIRPRDFDAPELHAPGGPQAKTAVSRIAMGKRAVCRLDHRSHDRVVARCEIGGRSLGDLMGSAEAAEGGSGRQGPC